MNKYFLYWINDKQTISKLIPRRHFLSITLDDSAHIIYIYLYGQFYIYCDWNLYTTHTTGWRKKQEWKKKKTDASSREDGTEGRSKLQRPNRKENIQLNCHVRSSNNHCSCSSGYIAVYRFIAMVVIEWQQLYNRCLTTQRDEIKLRLVKYLSINLL